MCQWFVVTWKKNHYIKQYVNKAWSPFCARVQHFSEPDLIIDGRPSFCQSVWFSLTFKKQVMKQPGLLCQMQHFPNIKFFDAHAIWLYILLLPTPHKTLARGVLLCNIFTRLLVLLQMIQQIVKTLRNISFSILLIKCVSDEPTEPTRLVVLHLECHQSLIYGIKQGLSMKMKPTSQWGM